MDLISSLPIEIAQNIFKLLLVKDLYSCMAVCKSWRNIINCNYVWENLYKYYGIEEILNAISCDNESKTLAPLCTRAIELKRYVLSTAFNWRLGRSNSFYINLKYRQWKVVCCEPYFAVLYVLLNELHVFHCAGNCLDCIDIISVNLPKSSLEQPILISRTYIVLGAYNITLVYRLTDGHFELFKIFALQYIQIIHSTDNDFDHFIQQYISRDQSVFERVLLNDTLWITDISGAKHIIDLNSDRKEVFYNLPINTKAVQYSPYILNYLHNTVSITDMEGVVISRFTVSYMDKIFLMNATSLIICFPRVIENEQYEIECREIISGNLLRKLCVHERTRVTLHHKKAILYLLSTRPTVYEVTSLSIETGICFWRYEACCGPHMFWGSFLFVIDNRFLFVYPAPSSDEFYALFNLQGELLCERTFTPGILLYFSDAVVLAKEEGRLHLSTFL